MNKRQIKKQDKLSEIQSLKNQREAALRIIGEQRKELFELNAAVEQMSHALDGILAVLAKKYGEPEENERILRLNAEEIKTALNEARVYAEKDEESQMYIVRVRNKVTPDGDEC